MENACNLCYNLVLHYQPHSELKKSANCETANCISAVVATRICISNAANGRLSAQGNFAERRNSASRRSGTTQNHAATANNTSIRSANRQVKNPAKDLRISRASASFRRYRALKGVICRLPEPIHSDQNKPTSYIMEMS